MKIALSLILVLWSVGASAQQSGPQLTITRFFDGLSALNEKMMRETVTSDFELLEDGVVWNMDSLIRNMEPMRKQKFTRANTFTPITTEIRADIGWVSYYNNAVYTVPGRDPITRRWLESAVLVRGSDGIWRIRMLHSTRLPAEKK